MNATEFFSILVKVMGVVLAGAISALIPKVQEWLKIRLNSSEYDLLNKLVISFVKTAQQLYFADSGETRKQYVMNQIVAAGYEVTEEINNMIEAAVLDLHSKDGKDGKEGEADEG